MKQMFAQEFSQGLIQEAKRRSTPKQMGLGSTGSTGQQCAYFQDYGLSTQSPRK